MKCEQCNHEAVKIKKNHFCPNCGKKVLKTEIKQNISEPSIAEVSSTIVNKTDILNKNESNVLNLREVKKIDDSLQKPQVQPRQKPQNVEDKELENIPNHIKSIIEKHTEPSTKEISDNKNFTPKVANINIAKKAEISSVPLEKEKSQIKSAENVFSSKKNEVFWDKPTKKKNMIPTKKEKTLKSMLTLVIVLNVLVVLGIVYLLVT